MSTASLSIDLNGDVGEWDSTAADAAARFRADADLAASLTSLNVACGGHAGDAGSMRALACLARDRGLALGAHPSFPDRSGFGRRPMTLPPADIERLVVEQVSGLVRIAAEEGIDLGHVKPHGALYNLAATDATVAFCIARGVARVNPGLVLVALLVFLVLGTILMATTSLKGVYDAREGGKLDPVWRDCADEMITVVPGLVLSLLETILLAAVSLAVSTRLGMVPNLIICFTVYALGHLVPLIVQSSVGKFAIVRFVGQFFATILPVLEHFTIEAAVVGGVPVPWSYLGWAALYSALYSAVALLVALVLFQDRDLA